MKRWVVGAVVLGLVLFALSATAGQDGYKQGLVAHYFKDVEHWGGTWPDPEGPDVDGTPYTFSEYRYSRKEPLINHLFIRRGWFSVRWTGYLYIPPGYMKDPSAAITFEVWADDGCRLFLNGEKLIDSWKPTPETEPRSHRTASKTLGPGYHRIVVEYFQGASLEKDDQDPAKLYWSSSELGVSRKVIPASHLFHTAEDLNDWVPSQGTK